VHDSGQDGSETGISAKTTFGLKHIEWTGNASSSLLFYGAVREMEPFFKNADRTIQTILTVESTRLIVLEAWLFCDFSIRTIVLAAIDQKHVNLPEYDLRYQCLPSGFEGCIQLLLKIRRTNAALSRDPEERRVKIDGEFFNFLFQEHRDFVDRFMELERAFYKSKYPQLAEQVTLTNPVYVGFGESSIFDRGPKTKHARVPSEWLEATESVDQDWLKRARRLNRARNMAAHSHDGNAIAEALGITGPNTLQRVRDECVQIVTDLWGFRVDKQSVDPAS
jgi:hypothetical protein